MKITKTVTVDMNDLIEHNAKSIFYSVYEHWYEYDGEDNDNFNNIKRQLTDFAKEILGDQYQ